MRVRTCDYTIYWLDILLIKYDTPTYRKNTTDVKIEGSSTAVAKYMMLYPEIQFRWVQCWTPKYSHLSNK